MNYDKNSFLSGVAVGRQLRGWPGAVTGDLCVMGPVICSMEIKRPYSISDTAAPLAQGVSLDVLTMVSAGITVHNLIVFSDAAEALAEEMNDEQHDISGAYVYTGDVQEVSMMSENTNDNLNEEEIAVTGVTMEVDS